MPRRDDISSILILGSGPIVIGQAAEFDYSGTQACRALRDEGYRIILANSNPATIMTDPEFADATYIEPLTVETVAEIIRQERPEALLPTLGGQTALNLAIELDEAGVLDDYDVELLGANVNSIQMAEDRQLFHDAMDRLGLKVPESRTVKNLEQAQELAGRIGFPLIIRPSFTLGGKGGAVANDYSQLERAVADALDASPVNSTLVEKSVAGWKEFELEVMRDLSDNVVIICSIENVDPMGVHTGDSITVAPAQTLSDRQYQTLRSASIRIIREIGVETGGSNIQFAVDPESDDFYVIEMNPRVSRSSALASKATGFPNSQNRREAGGGLRAGRNPERHNPRNPGLVRAGARLRGNQDPPLHLREVSRRRTATHDQDALHRRGHGDRTDFYGEPAQGDAVA